MKRTTTRHAGNSVHTTAAVMTQDAAAAPSNTEATNKVAASALGNVLAIFHTLLGTRGRTTQNPYSPAGAEKLAQRLYDIIYESSPNRLSQCNVPIGAQVELRLTVPRSASCLRVDNETTISLRTNEGWRKSAQFPVSLRVFDVTGVPRVAVVFRSDDGQHDLPVNLAESEGRTCLVQPDKFAEFLWTLAQATKVEIVRSSGCSDDQAKLIADPMMSFAEKLQRDFLKPGEYERDVSAMRQGAASAVQAAQIVANIGSPLDLKALASQLTVEAIADCVPSIMSAAKTLREEIIEEFGIIINSLMGEHPTVMARGPVFVAELDISGQLLCHIVRTEYFYGNNARERGKQAKMVESFAASNNPGATPGDLNTVGNLVFCALAILDQHPRDMVKIAKSADLLYQVSDAYYRLWYILVQYFATEFLLWMA